MRYLVPDIKANHYDHFSSYGQNMYIQRIENLIIYM